MKNLIVLLLAFYIGNVGVQAKIPLSKEQNHGLTVLNENHPIINYIIEPFVYKMVDNSYTKSFLLVNNYYDPIEKSFSNDNYRQLINKNADIQVVKINYQALITKGKPKA
jgi:hypothetical protein